MTSAPKPWRYDSATNCIYDARGRLLVDCSKAHLTSPRYIKSFGKAIVSGVNEYDRILFALKSLHDGIVEENGNLGRHEQKTQDALRLAAAALAAAGKL